MNTQFIYVSNIPSNFKPVLLLHELNNKWARMLYLENTFSGLRDAFIYNPTENYQHFNSGVNNLKNKIIDSVHSLSVFYVWFPPLNVFMTTLIPAGASMLSYIFVENLHKDVVPTELIYDLPLQVSDIKTWDIPERPDKCVVIKLPANCNPAMRSYVLGTLRRRPVRGEVPRVSELLVSEHSQLSGQLVPRSIKTAADTVRREPYLSNFFYVHDIPSNLTVKMLVDSTKTENIRGARVFFVETHNNKKYGFMYVPRSLPNVRFMALHDKLKMAEWIIPDTTPASNPARLKIDQAWFKPLGAAEPPAVKENSDGEEMILSQYLYLSGVPPHLQAAQLAMGTPWPLNMYLFQVNEVSTQIGFVVLRGFNEQQVSLIVEYLRNLDFSGSRIEVEEVYIHCHGLDTSQPRPFQLQPRFVSSFCAGGEMMKRVPSSGGGDYEGTSVSRGQQQQHSETMTVVLTRVPDDDSSLMKSDFICVDNLPRSVSKAALVFDMGGGGAASDGCVILPRRDGTCTAFVYFPDCGGDNWKSLLSRLCQKTFSTGSGGRAPCPVYEVYLKTDVEGSSSGTASNFRETDVVFVYNISREVDSQDICQLAPSAIESCEVMETTSGSKSAFILLGDGPSPAQRLALLYGLRKKFLRGKPVYADLIQLASVKMAVSAKQEQLQEDCGASSLGAHLQNGQQQLKRIRYM